MISRSIVSNWFGFMISGLVSLLLTPLLLHRLGDVFFGLWVLAASLLDYYGALDIGMRTALFHFIARFHGADDAAELRVTLATAITLALLVSALLLALLPVAVIVLPRCFSLAPAARTAFAWTIAWIGLSLALTFPARVLGSYLSGVRRFDLYNVGAVCTVVLRGALMAAALLAGYGLVALAVAACVASTVSLVLNLYLLRRADARAAIDLRLTRRRRAREIVGYSIFAFFNVCGEQLRSYSDAVVIGRVLAMSLIAPFSIAIRLIEYMKSILAGIASPILGRLSELSGAGRVGELRRYFLRSTRYMALATLFLSVLLAVDGRALIVAWVGAAYASSYVLLLILLSGYVVANAQTPSQLLVLAIARHRFLGYLTLSEGAANIILSIVWGRRFGLVGVALGTVVPLLGAKLVIQPIYTLSVARVPLGQYLSEALLAPLAVGVLFGFILRIPGFPQPGPGIAGLAGAMFCQICVFSLLCWTIGLDADARRALRGWVRRAWASRALTASGGERHVMTPPTRSSELP
ncbi:MAG: lipopolysaccharide biosynthesis protein [Terriglobales bacterium]